MEGDDRNRSMAEDVIVAALEAARTRASAAEQERAKLDHAIAIAREEERLLEELLTLRRDGISRSSTTTGIVVPETSPPSFAKSGRSAIQAVVEELQTAGRPLHISELMRLLQTRGVEIPGSGTQANLITHLRRDARVVRPSRGMYALATFGLQNMPVPRRRRRRRKRMHATKHQEGAIHDN